MVQSGEGLGFACEPGQAIGVGREGVRQDLQRDIAIELRVACTKDLSHSAFAYWRGDLVSAEAGTGSQSQFGVNYMSTPWAENSVRRSGT